MKYTKFNFDVSYRLLKAVLIKTEKKEKKDKILDSLLDEVNDLYLENMKENLE